MDYHVVAYTNYELVGLPLPKLWASFSISQVESGSWQCRQVFPAWESSKWETFPETRDLPIPQFFLILHLYHFDLKSNPGDSILHTPLVLPLHLSSAWGEPPFASLLYSKAKSKPKCWGEIWLKFAGEAPCQLARRQGFENPSWNVQVTFLISPISNYNSLSLFGQQLIN